MTLIHIHFKKFHRQMRESAQIQGQINDFMYIYIII